MERPIMRTAVLALLAALLTVAVAPVEPAEAASTVSVEGGVLLVVAAPGDSSRVSVSPPSADSPNDYAINDSAGGTAGPGCRPGRFSSVDCPAAGVQRTVVRLGDGDDTAGWGSNSASVPVEFYGEAGRDDIRTPAEWFPGTLADGGEGDDTVFSANLARGGPGADMVSGLRILEGGEGNDILVKSGFRADGSPGTLDAGPGDDLLRSSDGQPDQLNCGAGRDVVEQADASDRRDSSCESAKEAKPPPRPQVTVFELPKGRSRPDRKGRLAVWMRCNLPRCAMTVQIRAAGEFATKFFVRFKPRQAPIRKLVVGTKAKLVRLKLSRAQRRGLRRQPAHSGLVAVVTASGPTGRTKTFTDGTFCTRRSPCGGGGGGGR